jgi:GNAT superfamily N-acetyltransferase
MCLPHDLTDMICPATIRTSEPGDRTALADLHAEAWRFAYRGIIPGIALERMIARRGPAWWESQCGPPHGAVVLEFDNRVVGYTTFGGCRTISSRRMGEIAELYVRPECQGAGFGRSLFEEARRRLRARALRGLLVWALAENDLACAFYAAMGGQRRLRTFETLGGARLEKIAFVWA